MNYRGKVVGITGINGFIGDALYRRLEKQGAYINVLTGDVRDPETFSGVNYEYDYIFHFSDPSSQILFKRQPLYAADVTLNGFINAATICRKNGVKLIYPSTGLLSQNRVNEYAQSKKICEDIHIGENLDALAIRIFATYGPGEYHKRDYASVPYLFARDMVNGKSPVIWGDGEQVRDFIYIDDVVESILHLTEECNDPVVDVGSGEAISFNQIIAELRNALSIVDKYGAKDPGNIPDAIYVDRPSGYVEETLANPEVLKKYYVPCTSFSEGIAGVVEALKNEKSNSNHDNQSAN